MAARSPMSISSTIRQRSNLAAIRHYGSQVNFAGLPDLLDAIGFFERVHHFVEQNQMVSDCVCEASEAGLR